MPLLDRLMGRGNHPQGQQGHEEVVDGDAADCPVCNPSLQQEPARGKHDSQFMQSARTGYQGSEPASNVRKYEVPVSSEQQGVVNDIQHQELKKQQVGSEPIQVFDDAQTRNGVNLPEDQYFDLKGPVQEEVGVRQQKNSSSEIAVPQTEQPRSPRSPKKQGIASKVKKLFQPEHERRQERYVEGQGVPYAEGQGVGTQDSGMIGATASRQDVGTMTSKTTDNVGEVPTEVSAPGHSASAGGLSPRGDWTPVEGFSFRHSTTPPPHLSRREEKAAKAVEKHDQGYDGTSEYDSAQDNLQGSGNCDNYGDSGPATFDVPHSRPGRYASGEQGGQWGDHRASEVGSFRGAGMHSPSRKRPTSERPYWTVPGSENDPAVAAAAVAGESASGGRDRNVRARDEARGSGVRDYSSSPDNINSARTRSSGFRSFNNRQGARDADNARAYENGAGDWNRSQDSQPLAREFENMLAPQNATRARTEGDVYDPRENNSLRQSRKHRAGTGTAGQGYNNQPLENYTGSQAKTEPRSEGVSLQDYNSQPLESSLNFQTRTGPRSSAAGSATQGYNSQPLGNSTDSHNMAAARSSTTRGIDQPRSNQSSVNTQDMSGAVLSSANQAQPSNDIQDYYQPDGSQPKQLERAAFGSGQDIGYDDDVQRMKGMKLEDEGLGAHRGYGNQASDARAYETRRQRSAGYDNQAFDAPAYKKKSVQNAGYDNQAFDVPQHESYRPTFENEVGNLQSGNRTKPGSGVTDQNRLGVNTFSNDQGVQNFDGFRTSDRNGVGEDLARTDREEQDFNRGRFHNQPNANNRLAQRTQSFEGNTGIRGGSEHSLGDGGVGAARNQYGLGDQGQQDGTSNGRGRRTGLEAGALGAGAMAVGIGAAAADVDRTHAGVPREYARSRQESNIRDFDGSEYQGESSKLRSNNQESNDTNQGVNQDAYNQNTSNNNRENHFNNENSNNPRLSNSRESNFNNQGFNDTTMSSGNQEFNKLGGSQLSDVHDNQGMRSRSNRGWGDDGVREQQYGLEEQGQKQGFSHEGVTGTGMETGALGSGAVGMGAAAAEAVRKHDDARQDIGRVGSMGSGEPRLKREDEIALGQGKAAETPLEGPALTGMGSQSRARAHAQTEQSDLDKQYVKEGSPTNAQGPILTGMSSQSRARAHAQTEQSDLDNQYVKEAAPASPQETATAQAEAMDVGSQESPRAQQYQYIQHSEPVRSGGLLFTAKHALGRAQNKLTNAHHHLTAGGTNISSVTGVAFGKLDVVTKRMLRGGDHLWREAFHPSAEEYLRKSFACLLSTENGAVAGVLYLSDHNLWFCSDRALQRAVKSEMEPGSPPAIQQYLYKVVLPLADVGSVNTRASARSERDKSIKVEMVGGEEFWFFGFVNFEKALMNLEQAGEYHKFRSASMKAGGA